MVIRQDARQNELTRGRSRMSKRDLFAVANPLVNLSCEKTKLRCTQTLIRSVGFDSGSVCVYDILINDYRGPMSDFPTLSFLYCFTNTRSMRCKLIARLQILAAVRICAGTLTDL